jgi:hypothetical protein
MIDEFTLNSSWLLGGSYDSDTNTLVLRLQNGSEYSMEGVPADTVEGLKTAASPGSFFARNIKGRF